MTTTWRDFALCRGMDPEVFYARDKAGQREAALICLDCPVRLACLDAGLSERFGVWGGLATYEREPLRKYRQVPPQRLPERPMVVCGTVSGYKAHRCKGEPPCASCRQTASARTRAAG